MSRRSRRARRPRRGVPPQSPLLSTRPATPASQHGSTSTWTEVITRALGQTFTSLRWRPLSWPRRGKKLWRRRSGKQSRKPGKRRSGRGRRKRSEKESGSVRRRWNGQRKLPVQLMKAGWESPRWPAPPTCGPHSTALRLRLQPCLLTSGPTRPPCAPSANTPGRTSCPPPTETTRSSSPSTPPTHCWPTTCPACTTPTRP